MGDKFEEGAEAAYTIHHHLQAYEDQELMADMVLGGDEGKECTYTKGYMKRQAIFSCLSCTPDGNAGICAACCFSCHDGHEITELWTKRNFRCDCGNSKFGAFYCKLSANKDVENADNSYNHNFRGLYCICERPCTEADLEEQLEMIQCCICEDWFHEEHLSLLSPDEIPRDDEGEPLYEDFICQGCSGVCSFLYLYPQTIWAAIKQSEADTTQERSVVENATSACGSSKELGNGSCYVTPVKLGCTITSVDDQPLTGEESLETNMQLKQCDKGAEKSYLCVVGDDPEASPPFLQKRRPMFLAKNWRDLLCRCGKCTAFYTQHGVGFLLGPEDSVVEYEKIAKQKRDEKLQQLEVAESSFLDKLGHIGKIEILSGIADMKNEIRDFVESHDTSKPVTSDDILELFENLKKKRRQSEF